MKVAFFLDKINAKITYSSPEDANPGIGGTQFLIWTYSYYLAKYTTIEVVLFTPRILPNMGSVTQIQANTILDCADSLKGLNIDYLIVRGPFIKNNVWNIFDEKKVKVIVWSHNFENYISIKNFKRHESFFCDVCVSKSQMLMLKDTDVYSKCKFIYNGLNFTSFNNIMTEKVKHRVCYIGNLYPDSGYLQFLKEWEKIDKAFPDAELYIIGGHNLYQGMDDNYSKKSLLHEKKIEHSVLYNSTGYLKKNVHFTGVIGGRDKLQLMASADVGVANITNAGETFGLSAIEFEALGVPVVSINKYGIRESVLNGETGILVDKYKEIHSAIEIIFSNDDLREKMAINAFDFVRSNFDIKAIIGDWNRFFIDPWNYNSCNSNVNIMDYHSVLLNSFLRNRLKLNKFPPILFYKYLYYGFRRLLQKKEII